MNEATMVFEDRGECYSFRVYSTSNRLLHATRSFPQPEGRAGAMQRLADWAQRTNTRIVDSAGKVVAEPAAVVKAARVAGTRYGRH